MSKILFITPMWHEEATPHDAKVCNYFVDEWIKQGHEVVIVHYRSQFPTFYHKIATVFPSLYKRLCGDNTRLKANIPETDVVQNGCHVLSIPVNKYVPHSKLSNRTYRKQANHLLRKLADDGFSPNVIIGHFCNPTIGIITELRKSFPSAKTAIVLHERATTIGRVLGDDAEIILNSFTAIGFRSTTIKESICSSYNLKSNLFICYSGVASSFVEKAYQTKEWQNGEVHSFLYVGRLANYKHPQAIVEALVKSYPRKDFSMTYIGSNDNAYAITHNKAVETGIIDKVAFLGQIKRDDIIGWYDKSDCFAMISDNEVFGLVYLEAMSRGCITIAGNNGGMVGIIEHGVNGFMCTPGDSDSLASIIETINNMTAEEKTNMSTNARNTALKFTDSQVAKNYLNKVIS